MIVAPGRIRRRRVREVLTLVALTAATLVGGVTPALASTPLPDAYVGEEYSAGADFCSPPADCRNFIYVTIEYSGLPPGLVGFGQISGSPTTEGTWNVTAYGTGFLPFPPGRVNLGSKQYTITVLPQRESLDTVAPLVEGAVDRAPNGAGWFNAPVTVTWVSSDPAPSSGPATVPPPSVLSTEGSGQLVISSPSCDPVLSSSSMEELEAPGSLIGADHGPRTVPSGRASEPPCSSNPNRHPEMPANRPAITSQDGVTNIGEPLTIPRG